MAKYTPFYDIHQRVGARIVEFAGFMMPIQYEGIIKEVLNVRRNVGVFDVSHMGEIYLRGKDAIPAADRLVSNDVKSLQDLQVLYSPMCYPEGGIVDDLLVYRLSSEEVLFVVNAANTEKDYQWIAEHVSGDVEAVNESKHTAQLAIQGPKAEAVMVKVVEGIELPSLQYYWAGMCKIAGVDVLISRTGYTGEDGFEVYFDATYAEKIWDVILSAGEEFGIAPAGLGARDILRLEMKYCLYGNDIDETTTPLEAGLGWTVKLDKGDFIGRDVLVKQKKEGVKRRLVGFVMGESRKIPRHGYTIFKDDEQVGEVTSGGFSPTLEQAIGMGYVSVPYHKSGTELFVEIRGEKVRAEVVKPPFYKQASHR